MNAEAEGGRIWDVKNLVKCQVVRREGRLSLDEPAVSRSGRSADLRSKFHIFNDPSRPDNAFVSCDDPILGLFERIYTGRVDRPGASMTDSRTTKIVVSRTMVTSDDLVLGLVDAIRGPRRVWTKAVQMLDH